MYSGRVRAKDRGLPEATSRVTQKGAKIVRDSL